MDSFADAIDNLIKSFRRVGNSILDGFSTLELWMRGQLSQFGLTAQVQTIVMLALAVVLILVSCQLFSGLVRMVAVLMLIALALHIVLPVLQH